MAVHEKGRAHLLDPARLWSGSREVLGRTAEVYGEPRPVPAAALAGADDLARHGVRTVPTPGHASHHQCFVHAGTLYVGEAAGTYLDLVAEGFVSAEPAAANGAGSGTEPSLGYYLRPATPPRFDLEVALASLERLLALRPPPARIAFAHHGLHTGEHARCARGGARAAPGVGGGGAGGSEGSSRAHCRRQGRHSRAALRSGLRRP